LRITVVDDHVLAIALIEFFADEPAQYVRGVPRPGRARSRAPVWLDTAAQALGLEPIKEAADDDRANPKTHKFSRAVMACGRRCSFSAAFTAHVSHA
jgi:hypothetical protein